MTRKEPPERHLEMRIHISRPSWREHLYSLLKTQSKWEIDCKFASRVSPDSRLNLLVHTLPLSLAMVSLSRNWDVDSRLRMQDVSHSFAPQPAIFTGSQLRIICSATCEFE